MHPKGPKKPLARLKGAQHAVHRGALQSVHVIAPGEEPHVLQRYQSGSDAGVAISLGQMDGTPALRRLIRMAAPELLLAGPTNTTRIPSLSRIRWANSSERAESTPSSLQRRMHGSLGTEATTDRDRDLMRPLPLKKKGHEF